MRSLGTIRARVERLAAVGLPGAEPMIISWKSRNARCPACGTDVEGHAKALALAEARADRAQGDARVGYWAEEPTTCPRCHAPLLT